MEKHDCLKLLSLVLILLAIGGVFMIYSIYREAIVAQVLAFLDEEDPKINPGHDGDLEDEADGPEKSSGEAETEDPNEEEDIYSRGGSGPIAYLTFDDGPSINTPSILDILRSYKVLATFFVTGKDNQAEEGIYRRIIDEGHVLGNHTYSHDYSRIYRSKDSFMNDLREMENLLLEQTGVKTEIMRFPGGTSIGMARRIAGYDIIGELISTVKEEGYDYFDWNVDSGDGINSPGPKDILSNVLGITDELQSDVVILFHDRKGCESTVEILPEIIIQLRARGYEFLPLFPGAIDINHR